MDVILVNYSEGMLENVVNAIRTCWDSFEKQDSNWWHDPHSGENGFSLGENDAKLIGRIIDSDHTSTLEHLNFTFAVSGISRAMLAELSRHRHSSLSVRSTRYTLKKSLSVPIPELVVSSGDKEVDKIIDNTMMAIVELCKRRPDIGRDVIKYAIPEALRVDLYWTINARSLRNVFKLRTSPAALPEFRQFCKQVWGELPDQVKFIFQDVYALGDKIQ